MSDFDPPASEPKRWRDLAISAMKTGGIPTIDGKPEYAWSFVFAGVRRGILRNRWMELIKEPDEDKYVIQFIGYNKMSDGTFGDPTNIYSFVGTYNECSNKWLGRWMMDECKDYYLNPEKRLTYQMLYIGKPGEWKRVDIDDNEYSKSVDF